jgi:hypothetical protein
VFVLQTSLLRFGRGSHPGFFAAASHLPNLHSQTPKNPPPVATWLPSDLLLGAVQQPIPPPVRSPAIGGRPRCGKLLLCLHQLRVGIHPSSVASRPKPRFRTTLEVGFEEMGSNEHVDSVIESAVFQRVFSVRSAISTVLLCAANEQDHSTEDQKHIHT